eukprot:GHVR01144744.1.p1 GENE.GHVR01144744.1~~GHVR01144744.1.p1  ORF type:complete len:421 (+),score=98.85 GHVR01144744.1:129-1391(+)
MANTVVAEHMLTAVSNVRTSPKWSFGGRHSSRFNGGAPGPGQYQPSVDGKFYTSAKFGFGTSERKHLGGACAPGPGTYEQRRGLDAPAFSCTPRRSGPQSRFMTPGPGTYKYGVYGKDEPKWGFGSGTRGALSAPGTPGPGTYNGDHLVSSPKWGMGSGARQPLAGTKNVPGPGTYCLPEVLQQGPKFTVRGKKDIKIQNSVPGPGQYVPNTHGGVTSPSYGFGIKTGSCFFSTNNPGPGAYGQNNILSSTRPLSPNWTFGTGGRDGIKGNMVPGPGQYQQESPSNASKWGFGTGKRVGLGFNSGVPGPGTYATSGTSCMKGSIPPQYSLTPRRPMVDKAFTPGPGAYQPGLSQCDKEPEWGFSRGQRSGLGDKSQAPGPGSYNQNTNTCGPMYSMRAKPVEKMNIGSHNLGGTYSQFGY